MQNSYQLNDTSDPIEYDIGIDFPKPDRGRTDELTPEDVEWAIEKGATSEDDIFKLVAEHKKELAQWQQ